MTRRTLTQERARDFFANATAWDFGDHHGRPDLELMREKRYEEWDQMIAKVRADALREAIEDIDAAGLDAYTANEFVTWLSARADRIERGGR